MRRLGLALGALMSMVVASGGIGAQGQIPAGFTRLFNGRDLTGWHISRTTHHGATGLYTVKDGVLLMAQQPFGQGGLLMTDKVYKDFDLYLELNPDAGFNSGIFLRSTESGSAYQIEVVAPGETTGNSDRRGHPVQSAEVHRRKEACHVGVENRRVELDADSHGRRSTACHHLGQWTRSSTSCRCHKTTRSQAFMAA